jgi:hypothetical protein
MKTKFAAIVSEKTGIQHLGLTVELMTLKKAIFILI